MPPGCQKRLLILLLTVVQLYAYEAELPDDPMRDDNKQAVDQLRNRLKTEARSKGNGVLMVTGPKELAWSQMTIPIWRAYCEKHKLGFFLQQEPLNPDFRFEWTKPRTLIEFLKKTRWKYVYVVDANSLPVDLNRTWEFVIKQHMRHKRYSNDNPKDRTVFCPWDCEADYDDAYSEGACYGAQLSGCIYMASKPKAQRFVKRWYYHRNEDDWTPDQALVKAFSKAKERHWDEVFLRDVRKEIGYPESSYMATFHFTKKYEWNIRDHIYDFIKGHEELGPLANKVFNASFKALFRPEELGALPSGEL